MKREIRRDPPGTSPTPPSSSSDNSYSESSGNGNGFSVDLEENGRRERKRCADVNDKHDGERQGRRSGKRANDRLLKPQKETSAKRAQHLKMDQVDRERHAPKKQSKRRGEDALADPAVDDREHGEHGTGRVKQRRGAEVPADEKSDRMSRLRRRCWDRRGRGGGAQSVCGGAQSRSPDAVLRTYGCCNLDALLKEEESCRARKIHRAIVLESPEVCSEAQKHHAVFLEQRDIAGM